jgi:hypothetical protein
VRNVTSPALSLEGLKELAGRACGAHEFDEVLATFRKEFTPEVILGLIARVEMCERIASAADGLLTADSIVHPTLSREEATRLAWQRLSTALGPWHARQCASSAVPTPAPQEPEGR